VTSTRAPLSAERRRGRIAKRDRVTFLAALAAGWAVRHAAKLAGHSFQRWYELRDSDEDFAAAWAEAIEQGTQRLEDEALRRAVDGYDEETFDGEGTLVRRVRRYDGALLQTLLKGRRPEKYRDGATVEVQAPTVFVLDSAFARHEPIEVVEAEPPLELPAGEVTET
jgi:hypothetical protein